MLKRRQKLLIVVVVALVSIFLFQYNDIQAGAFQLGIRSAEILYKSR